MVDAYMRFYMMGDLERYQNGDFDDITESYNPSESSTSESSKSEEENSSGRVGILELLVGAIGLIGIATGAYYGLQGLAGDIF